MEEKCSDSIKQVPGNMRIPNFMSIQHYCTPSELISSIIDEITKWQKGFTFLHSLTKDKGTNKV